jgi:uncharacterized protein (DUF4415 family)
MKMQQDEKLTRAIITEDGRVMLEQADGSYLPAGKGKTNFSQLDAMQDSNIDYSEIPELDEEFFKAASVPLLPKKQQLTIRIDSDLLEWLKNQGQGYHTRINTILRAYMKVHKSRCL